MKKNFVFEKFGTLLLKTKTGLARAAVRDFLNQQVVDCYFQALLLDQQLLCKYYDQWALLRDPDNSEIVKNSLQGLENLKFSFATNTPMLDTWSRHTLELAAIVAPNHEKNTTNRTNNREDSGTHTYEFKMILINNKYFKIIIIYKD